MAVGFIVYTSRIDYGAWAVGSYAGERAVKGRRGVVGISKISMGTSILS